MIRLVVGYCSAVSRLIATYCARGPYRHVRDLVSAGASWLPWGYRTGCVQDELELAPGDLVELWELDDLRAPRQAKPVCVASVDFISRTEGYLAFTLLLRSQEHCLVAASEVLDAATRDRSMLASLPIATPVAG